MEAQKAWFITGTSRGFGVEITREALQHGDRVVGRPGISRPSSRQSGNTQTYSRSNSK